MGGGGRVPQKVAAHDRPGCRVDACKHERLDGHFPRLLSEHWGLKMAKLPTHAAAFGIQESRYSPSARVGMLFARDHWAKLLPRRSQVNECVVRVPVTFGSREHTTLAAGYQVDSLRQVNRWNGPRLRRNGHRMGEAVGALIYAQEFETCNALGAGYWSPHPYHASWDFVP